jgi:signal transduction histidine kinase
MDTDLAPIVAGEVIRDPAMYRTSFFTSDYNGVGQQQAAQQANSPAAQLSVPLSTRSQLLPSPLLLELPPYVVCNFEATLDGKWTSPQVPEAAFVGLALDNGISSDAISDRAARLAELSAAVDPAQLLTRLPESTLPSLVEINRNFADLVNADSIKNFNDVNRGLNYYAGNAGTVNTSTDNAVAPPGNEWNVKGGGKTAIQSPASRQADYFERSQRYQSVAQQGMLEQQQQFGRANNTNTITPNLPAEGEPAERIGVTRPIWIGDRLLLARRVDRGRTTLVQGAWLDWPRLRTRLLAQTVDLVPEADLVPVTAQDAIAADPGRMLAGLPVRLLAHEAPSAAGELSPTLRMALWIGWGALAFAAAAAAIMLGGVMALSERRAAFVSSVTHELRTPLTTFRMYAEMLSRGMVPEAARRQEYLNTLQREAERLSHLVENVLAYARLERGRKPNARDCITPQRLFDRIGPRLTHRAHEAEMECIFEADADTADAEFTTDLGVVEQILFNLIDNAAKYARTATDRRIHVLARRNGRTVEFAVRDHGPGIQRNGRPARMRPFGKSAEEAAESAPGVGLGLALCRRLARQLGGRLEILPANGGGAAVSLFLPVS